MHGRGYLGVPQRNGSDHPPQLNAQRATVELSWEIQMRPPTAQRASSSSGRKKIFFFQKKKIFFFQKKKIFFFEKKKILLF